MNYKLIRSALFPAARFIISLLLAILLIWGILCLWKGLGNEETTSGFSLIPRATVSTPTGGETTSGFNFGYEIGRFFNYAVHSFFLIISALIFSSMFTGISLLLSTTKIRVVGLGVKTLLYILSSIPCIFAGYFLYSLINMGRYNELAPVTRRWMYYIIPAIVLGIGDGFLSELLLSSEDEINAIKREGYVRMAKLTGASMWKHIKNDLIIHTSRAFFSRTAALLSGTVIVEFIFGIPGLGWLAFEAAERRNFLQLLGVLFCTVVVVGFLNFMQRLLAVFLDPRLR